jgi:hypothetical protein
MQSKTIVLNKNASVLTSAQQIALIDEHQLHNVPFTDMFAFMEAYEKAIIQAVLKTMSGTTSTLTA